MDFNLETLFEKSPTIETLALLLDVQAKNSEKEKAIVAKNAYLDDFAKAQSEMNAAIATKQNTFFGNKYSTIEDVWDAVHGCLNKYGISVRQPSETHPGKDGLPLVVVTTKLSHKHGYEDVSVSELQTTAANFAAQPGKRPPSVAQVIGGVVTYIRRISLSAATGIPMGAEEDNDGNGSGSGTPGAESDGHGQPSTGKTGSSSGKDTSSWKDKPISEAQYRLLANKIGEKLKDLTNDKRLIVVDGIKAKFEIEDLKTMPVNKFQNVLDHLVSMTVPVFDAPAVAENTPVATESKSEQPVATEPKSEAPVSDGKPAEATVPAVISNDQYRELAAVFQEVTAGMIPDEKSKIRFATMEAFGISDIKNLPVDRLSDAINFLRAGKVAV